MDQETKTGYEPDRIPLSVFACTMTPKQEWSIQSNESLFSIHMGDQSFSNMYKSGELSNFDHISYINDNKITLSDAGTKETNLTIVETKPKTANQDGLTKPDPTQQVPFSPTKSYGSNASNNSLASFAFPTLPEYQQDRKTLINVNNASGKPEMSRPDSKACSYPDDPKSSSGGGWLSCFFCFSVKK